MKSILIILISFALVVSGASQTRNVVVGTNGAVVQPTNFWSADASNARTGLGLGSAATNPASAFQPSSSILTNIASGNAFYLTNVQASNISGVVSVSSGGTGATNASDARTYLGLGSASTNPSSAFQGSSVVLSNLALSNGINLTNILATNISGTLQINNGGTGATNISGARSNLGATTVGDAIFTSSNASSARSVLGATTVGSDVFTAIDASSARTAIGLGTSATNPAAAFQSSSSVLSNLASSNAVNLTNVRATNIVGSIALASNVSGIVSIANGGTGGTTAGEARTNLNAQQASVVLSNLANSNGGNLTNISISNLGTILITGGGTGATNAATARTNLGLGWSALTNTNAATSLLGFTTNGQVLANTGTNVLTFTSGVAMNKLQLPNGTFVDDAQFAAPQYADALLSFEENRLYQHGLNIIEWSTNGAVTFGNAAATRTNLGLGSSWLTNANNPVFVNTNGEVVSPTNFWQVAPIQTLVQTFAQVTNSTNAATNARNLYVYSLATNIINVTNTITFPTNTSAFDGDEVTVIHRGGSNSVTIVRQLGSTNNLISLNSYDEAVKFIKDGSWDFYHNISYTEDIRFSGTNAAANAAASRTNLGIPLTALTNTSVTNFQKGIFHTNTAPSNIGGNLGSIAAWIEIVASNGVTYKVPAYTNIP